MKNKLNIRDIAVFGMLGALMFASKLLMDVLPNIHLIGVFTVAITAVYRRRALFPLYIFIFLTGLYGGFSTWWIPYLYIWTVLWGAVMLLPKKAHPAFYVIVCSLHGFLYGTLYAPVQAIIYGFSFKATLSWIAAGLWFDFIHGVSNLIAGALLIYPLIKVLKKLEKK